MREEALVVLFVAFAVPTGARDVKPLFDERSLEVPKRPAIRKEAVMRMALVVLICVGCAGVATAQEPEAGRQCYTVAPTTQVVMTMSDGATLRATLLCLGHQEATIASAG